METMGAAGHWLYCRLWPSGAGSNLWRALIRSWVMPHSTGSIEIKRGGEKTLQSTTAEVAAIVVAAAAATATAMATAAATAMAKALEMTTTTAETVVVAAAPERRRGHRKRRWQWRRRGR
jgi:hypothetical protein